MLRDYLAASAPWLEFRATTFADYLDTFPATSVNTIMLVGHHTLRLMAMGADDRPPSPDELRHMQDLLDEALQAGALGLSSGLFTTPGGYADASGRCWRWDGYCNATALAMQRTCAMKQIGSLRLCRKPLLWGNSATSMSSLPTSNFQAWTTGARPPNSRRNSGGTAAWRAGGL